MPIFIKALVGGHQAVNGGDIDDGAAACMRHLAPHHLAAQDYALGVNLHHPVEGGGDGDRIVSLPVRAVERELEERGTRQGSARATALATTREGGEP